MFFSFVKRNYFFFFVCLIFTLLICSKNVSSAKTDSVSLFFKDKAVFAINNKTYFLSELNEILISLKYLKCFQTSSLKHFLGTSNQRLAEYKKISFLEADHGRFSKRLDTLIFFAKLENFSQGKNVFSNFKSFYKLRVCSYPLNKMTKRLLFLEMYLNDRFSLSDSRSFKETIMPMINIKMFE